MPVRRVASKTRDFETHDNPSLTERHLAHELLEAIACCCIRSGFTKIAIDDMDAIDRPARRHRPITQRVLALRTLAVLGNLAKRRLANMKRRPTSAILGPDPALSRGRGPLQCSA